MHARLVMLDDTALPAQKLLPARVLAVPVSMALLVSLLLLVRVLVQRVTHVLLDRQVL